MLPQRGAVQDEIYNFKSHPVWAGAVVLLSIDYSSYARKPFGHLVYPHLTVF